MLARLVCPSARPLHRQFGTISQRHTSRFYRYAVDVHGQLFLHDTTPKNLTSCFKNPQFLDFFFARIKPNEHNHADTGLAQLEEEWTERKDLTMDHAFQLARLDGYGWVSPCQGEINFVRAESSPIVFRELDEDGTLRWAGSQTSTFSPADLKVDASTGYVYHPSPAPPLRSGKRLVEEGGVQAHPFGPYSLLSSALVLQRLASGLDIDPDAFADGKGGSIEWKGERWEMGILGQGNLV